MRIAFFDSDYTALLQAIYGGNVRAATGSSYRDLLARRNATLFARLDYLADAVTKVGHQADGFYVNNLPLQMSWLKERRPSRRRTWTGMAGRAVFRMRRLASHGRVLADRCLGSSKLAAQADAMLDVRNPLIYEILAEQIRNLKPDIVYNHDPALVDGRFFKSIPGFSGKLVAQIASPYPDTIDWRPYDLVISSLPNFVHRFRKEGVPAAYLPLYFAPQVLNEVGTRQRDLALTFVGSVGQVHAQRRKFLEHVAGRLPLDLYGVLQGEREGTPLTKSYRGPAWGRDMYVALARSRLTLNRHIDVADGFANNLRLYEATGMGACLLTERRQNLPELFEPGREVIAYDSDEECVDLCRYYMNHSGEADAIAAAGQRRCLADHTVERHAERLVGILRDRL
jgi:spore maturation protein CgeB